MELQAVVEEDVPYLFEFRVRLGALGFSWEQGPVHPDASGLVSLVVTPPPEAFLHDLATDYVTDMAVLMVGHDPDRKIKVYGEAPPVFLAWPSGRDGGVEIWDRATALARAPRGVVSDTVRASLLPAAAEVRVLAPVGRGSPPPADEVALVPED